MTRTAKILIVDDEQSFLESTAHILEGEGYLCHRAYSGKEGLAALAAGAFDLILADIRMPGNMELEFLREIKSRSPETPIIVITGYPSLDTAISSLQLRVWDYMVKPVDIEALLERIGACLNETMGAEA